MKNKKNIERYIELCNQGKTRKEISELLDITLRSVTNYINITGIKPKESPRKAKLNEDFFSIIDSEEKAYILGFIYADGYIETNERTLTFNINEKDIDILYKIKSAISCENEIKKSSTNNCVRLYLSSVKLVNDLKKLGITRKKSLIISFPSLEENLYRHFIRGFFDGDGYIGKRQCALVIGSDLFYKGFERFIWKNFKVNLYENKMKNYHRVQFNRKDYKIIKWIYNDSKIYLDRKYEMYLKYWNDYTERIRSKR